MTREERSAAITTICGKIGCNDEQKKRHHKLYVDEQWNVHPSKRFQKWWYAQQEYKESIMQGTPGISASNAQNARRIWQEYLATKEIGVA
jgi:hypothetical protein